MAIKVDNNKISTKDWGNVDKTALGNRLSNAYEAKEASKAVINECYAHVPDDAFEDDKFLQSKAKLPHHELIGNTLVLNRGGVIAASNALAGARGGVDLPAEARSKAKAHIRGHFADLRKREADKELETPKHLG